jgi:hypothetical protein
MRYYDIDWDKAFDEMSLEELETLRDILDNKINILIARWVNGGSEMW